MSDNNVNEEINQQEANAARDVIQEAIKDLEDKYGYSIIAIPEVALNQEGVVRTTASIKLVKMIKPEVEQVEAEVVENPVNTPPNADNTPEEVSTSDSKEQPEG